MVLPNVVFLIEEVHCAKEVDVGPHRPMTTRSAMLVPHNDRWLVAHAPTSGARSQAEIQILTIHKEPLIEQADLIDNLPSHEQTRAANRVDFDSEIRVDERQVVATESRALWKQPAQSN